MARNDWIGITTEAWLLSFEAANVMTLRMLKLCAGGTVAQAEYRRMITEKLIAASTLNWLGYCGALGHTPHGVAGKSLRHYRTVVRQNRRRLARS